MNKTRFIDVEDRRRIEALLEECDAKLQALWAADCAERVLALFEAALPQDERPRSAIDACRAWAQGKLTMSKARAASFAAHAAARDAGQDAAAAAARAAGHAVATAHVAGHAVHAATYAAKAVAYAGADTAAERCWQLNRLRELTGSGTTI